jgi:hypothetical protein
MGVCVSRDRGAKIEMNGIWKDMEEIYRKMGFKEEEIAEHITCKTTKRIEQKTTWENVMKNYTTKRDLPSVRRDRI